MPEETLRDFRRLVLDEANTAAKRMVAAALRGSHQIYLNKVTEQRTENNEYGNRRTRQRVVRHREEEEERETQPPGETETQEMEEDDPWLPEERPAEDEMGSKPESEEHMPEGDGGRVCK